ncbi:MAG TPA: hypothetical protein VF645_09545 [Allosphingosinicella sp.]|jgi:CheY-like chemotaxis protein
MIYLVDDEHDLLRPLIKWLNELGHEVKTFDTAASAYDELIGAPLGPGDLILLDLMLPSGPPSVTGPDFFNPAELYSGLSLARVLLNADGQRFKNRIAIYSAARIIDPENREWLRENGITFLQKHQRLEELVNAIGKAAS